MLALPKINLSQTSRRIIIISILIFLIVTAILLISHLFLTRSQTKPSSSTTPTPIAEVKSFTYPTDQYHIDTDQDSIPDAIETQLNLDPSKNEIQACYQNYCNDPAYQQAYIKKHNIVIILDSSGSMEQQISQNGETKMTAAKKAITSFINNLNNQAQIGLIQYGHLGSNSAKDKALSCSGTETLSPIGNLNKDNVIQVLSSVKSTGWTAIGLALQKSQEMFAGKEKDDNEVFVVTDGAETCDTDPVSAAAALAKSTANIKVNVIGFAINDTEKSSLEAINKAGQGSYTSANSSAELEEVFSRNLTNWKTLVNANDCVDQVRNQLISCIVGIHDKIDFFRRSYTDNPTVYHTTVSANENLYQKIIMYIQEFERQKFDEINRIKSGFLEGIN